MGLGDRGKNKVKEAAAPELFRMTEPLTPVTNDINTEIQIAEKNDVDKQAISEKNVQRKIFNLSLSLAERLRKCAYETRRRESEIAREAIEEWLNKQGY